MEIPTDPNTATAEMGFGEKRAGSHRTDTGTNQGFG